VERTARALWLRAPGECEIRSVELPAPGDDEVLVRSLFSGVSRGTEALVFRGGVPANQRETMRAPFQEGDFPAPVKYGYLNVGVVEQGPPALLGRTVFCLYPHQTRYVVPASAVTAVPADVPAERAVLAGTVETAVNALWDAAPLVGDRIAVVGGECDLVVHTSASEAGLVRALELLAPEGEVLEMSWYGDRTVALPLGEHFHSRRLTVRSSQVGMVSPARRARRTFADRLALALRLLADPRYDALVTGGSAFDELPRVMPNLLGGEPSGLLHRVSYGDG
jgi:threonine dehydrogenase-like Zn-dependent dehydrogenase